MAPKTANPKKTDAIETPDPEVVQKEYFPTVSSAKALIVTNKDEHQIGLTMLQQIAVAEKRVKDLFKDPKDAAHAAHKAICEAEKKLLVPLADARYDVQRKCLEFQSAEKRKAEEAQRKLQEEARRAEEERALADAIEAEESGDKKAAEQILAAPVAVPVVQVEAQVAKVAGVTSRVYYRCKVTDFLSLVKYVAANPHEIALLQPDETALRKRAESMKDGFKIPGCELDKQDSLSVKAL